MALIHECTWLRYVLFVTPRCQHGMMLGTTPLKTANDRELHTAVLPWAVSLSYCSSPAHRVRMPAMRDASSELGEPDFIEQSATPPSFSNQRPPLLWTSAPLRSCP